MTQLLISAAVSAASAVPVSLMDKLFGWYIDNQVYMTLVFLAVAIDHIIGTFVHWQIKRDWSPKKNLFGLIRKGFAVVAGYVLFEMVHQIVDDVEFISIYFKAILQLTVMLYPVISALKNLSIITGGKFPPHIWLEKFESFNKDLDLNHFKTTKNEETANIIDSSAVSTELQEQEEGAEN